MKLEKQVCSLELAKRLKELGVKQESYFMWASVKEGEHAQVLPFQWEAKKTACAFTVAELGEMLPQGAATFQRSQTNEYRCVPPRELQGLPSVNGDTEADARAKMLVYLIEMGLPKPEQEAA